MKSPCEYVVTNITSAKNRGGYGTGIGTTGMRRAERVGRLTVTGDRSFTSRSGGAGAIAGRFAQCAAQIAACVGKSATARRNLSPRRAWR